MKTFTAAEAAELLPDVRGLVGQIVELGQLIPELQDQARIHAYRAARSGGSDLEEQQRLSESGLRDAELSLQAALIRLEELGVVLKDAQAGLVDFPSYREGELVELCWKLGEAEVSHWHRVGEGFAGRKPL